MRTTVNPKNRMISFRLSDEEYNTYRDACVKAGVRSISELARTGLQQMFSVREGSGIDDKLNNLRERMQFLSMELERISEEVRRRDSSGHNGYNQ